MSEKRQIQVGDIVRQIRNVSFDENPLVKVIEIKEHTLIHQHLNKSHTNHAHIQDFKCESKEEIIYDE